MKAELLDQLIQESRDCATSNMHGGINFDVDVFHNKLADLVVQECLKIADAEAISQKSQHGKVAADRIWLSIKNKFGM